MPDPDKVWFKHPFTTDEQIESNKAKWLKAVAFLGSKWILMKKVEKNDATNR